MIKDESEREHSNSLAQVEKSKRFSSKDRALLPKVKPYLLELDDEELAEMMRNFAKDSTPRRKFLVDKVKDALKEDRNYAKLFNKIFVELNNM